MKEAVLDVSNLKVVYDSRAEIVTAVDGVWFRLNRGDVLGIFGESGCGKSSIARSIIRLLAPNGRIIEGKVLYRGENLLEMPDRKLRAIRGKDIAFVLQNPLNSFDPIMTIENHFFETLFAHSKVSKKNGTEVAIEMLRRVHLSAPERRIAQYPFEMSGGMLQRIMIALALINKPEVIIADEPTTALDVTTQAGILNEMQRLNRKYNVTFIVISHDIVVINQISNKILVMYAGKCVEYGKKQDVMNNTLHPYSEDLIRCIPRIDFGYSHGRLNTIPGQPPDLRDLPKGCSYNTRCSHAKSICFEEKPILREIKEDHWVSCFQYP
jgi:peptide/nickel transport system ATP-binding protein